MIFLVACVVAFYEAGCKIIMAGRKEDELNKVREEVIKMQVLAWIWFHLPVRVHVIKLSLKKVKFMTIDDIYMYCIQILAH